MEQSKEKEATVINLLLAALAVGTLAVAGWDLATSRFRGGTDDMFLILVCLLLALLFAINPLMWAYSKGWISNPLASVEDEVIVDAHAEQHGGSNRENVVIWGVLLGLTAIEVLLAYVQLRPVLMLIILMGLSIIKAALIVGYFMHLKFERFSFVLTVVPILVVLLCLFSTFFPDSRRVRELRSSPAVKEIRE